MILMTRSLSKGGWALEGLCETQGRDPMEIKEIVHPILIPMFPLANPSNPHKVAPGTHFKAMKYYWWMMRFPTRFTVAFL